MKAWTVVYLTCGRCHATHHRHVLVVSAPGTYEAVTIVHGPARCPKCDDGPDNQHLRLELHGTSELPAAPRGVLERE